jgi:hypothetical protein
MSKKTCEAILCIAIVFASVGAVGTFGGQNLWPGVLVGSLLIYVAVLRRI